MESDLQYENLDCQIQIQKGKKFSLNESKPGRKRHHVCILFSMILIIIALLSINTGIEVFSMFKIHDEQPGIADRNVRASVNPVKVSHNKSISGLSLSTLVHATNPEKSRAAGGATRATTETSSRTSTSLEDRQKKLDGNKDIASRVATSHANTNSFKPSSSSRNIVKSIANELTTENPSPNTTSLIEQKMGRNPTTTNPVSPGFYEPNKLKTSTFNYASIYFSEAQTVASKSSDLTTPKVPPIIHVTTRNVVAENETITTVASHSGNTNIEERKTSMHHHIAGTSKPETTTRTVTTSQTPYGDDENTSDEIPKAAHARDCSDHRQAGHTVSGWYEINVAGKRQISVYCDMDTDGGGWTMILRRQDGTVDFNLDWENYAIGFGNESEFWIGNDIIHELTMLNGRQYQVRFDLTSNTNGSRYATYSNVTVEDEMLKYKINFGDYDGNAGNALFRARGRYFSTHDRDNDRSDTHCANYYTGGWWYVDCYHARLTGQYGQGLNYAKGIVWENWLGYYNSLDYADMKIRPEYG